MNRYDSLAAVLAGGALYVQLMPTLSDVRRARGDSATARDVRAGLVMGSAALVGIGAIISVAEGDHRPILICAAAAGLLSGIYVATLRQTGEPDAPASSPAPPARWGR